MCRSTGSSRGRTRPGRRPVLGAASSGPRRPVAGARRARRAADAAPRPDHRWGVGLAGFLLERQAQGATFASDATGNPLLARPIFNPFLKEQTSVPISTPGTPPGVLPISNPIAGSIAIAQNLQFAGWELNLLR